MFYDTLLEQNPDSHMAQEWCVAYGTLPLPDAERIYNLICKRKNITVKKKSNGSPSKRAKVNGSSKA